MTFITIEADNGRWEWWVLDNDRVLAVSTSTYSTRSNARRAARTFAVTVWHLANVSPEARIPVD